MASGEAPLTRTRKPQHGGFRCCAAELVLPASVPFCYLRVHRGSVGSFRLLREVRRMVAHKPEEIIEMDVAQLESLVARIEQGSLEREDLQILRAVLESHFYVTQLIDEKSTTIA